MTVTIADLPAEFADTDSAISQFWLDTATEEVNVAWWTKCGVDPDRGIILLTAHYLKDAGEGASGDTGEGEVKSERVGEVTTAFGTSTSSTLVDGDHASTAYGRAFDKLLARVERCRTTKPAAMFVTTCSTSSASRARRRRGCAC